MTSKPSIDVQKVLVWKMIINIEIGMTMIPRFKEMKVSWPAIIRMKSVVFFILGNSSITLTRCGISVTMEKRRSAIFLKS